MISIILFVCLICSLILFAIVMYNTEYEDEDEPIISKHTNHAKTKEIRIIIDDDEYRFVFESKNK